MQTMAGTQQPEHGYSIDYPGPAPVFISGDYDAVATAAAGRQMARRHLELVAQLEGQNPHQRPQFRWLLGTPPPLWDPGLGQRGTSEDPDLPGHRGSVAARDAQTMVAVCPCDRNLRDLCVRRHAASAEKGKGGAHRASAPAERDLDSPGHIVQQRVHPLRRNLLHHQSFRPQYAATRSGLLAAIDVQKRHTKDLFRLLQRRCCLIAHNYELKFGADSVCPLLNVVKEQSIFRVMARGFCKQLIMHLRTWTACLDSAPALVLIRSLQEVTYHRGLELACARPMTRTF